LREHLEIAICARAMFDAGRIEIDCSDCGGDCSKFQGWYDSLNDIEYHTCPLNYIPRCVDQWAEQYAYEKEFGTTRSYGDTPALYWWFVKRYKYYKSVIEADRAKS
jgi:hypothetical protein